MNTLSLSVSNPSRSKGRSLRSSVKTALSRPCSRTSNGPHSVHPVAMSVNTSVCTKLPLAEGPLCATRSAETPEDAADRSRRDADRGCDLLARPALAAQGFDGRDSGCRRRPVEVMWPGGAIVQAFDAFGLEAPPPLAPRFDGYAESGRDGLHRLSLDHYPPHQFGSTVRRQPGILMNVHPVLRGDAEASQLQLPRSEPDGQPNEGSHQWVD